MSSNLNIGYVDATAMADLIRKREVSSAELVEDAIWRCEQVNGKLNAVITEMFDSALHLSSTPVKESIFSGVPFLMKDFAAEVAGVPFCEGSNFLEGYVPSIDSEIYKRFNAAGLITIGKTNLPEFAIGVTTEPKKFGATRNPWDLKRTPGGSSGGAGAAVASRMVPMAHGNDVGGSIRIPASACGLVGLKPSRGRSTLAPHYGDFLGGFFVENGLTRTVRDTAALLDAISGPHIGEPYNAPPNGDSYCKEIEREPGKLRIGFSIQTPLGDPLSSECVQAILDTAGICDSMGHIVEEVAPSFDAMKLWTNFTTVLACGVSWALRDWSRRLGRELSPEYFEEFVWAFGQRGLSLTAADYLLAVQDIQSQVRNLSEFYEDYDIWLTTTLGKPPVELGTLVYNGDPFELRRRMAEFSPYTYLANASGQPAISLPLYWTDENLPVGLHFTAKMGREDLLLRLAARLEQELPWNDKRPPVCAT